MQTIKVKEVSGWGNTGFFVDGTILANIHKIKDEYVSDMKCIMNYNYGCNRSYHNSRSKAIEHARNGIIAYFKYVGVRVEFEKVECEEYP